MHWKDYELIDCGDFEKLERFGNTILIRPEPQAVWSKVLSNAEWQRLHHIKFKGRSATSGEWLKKNPATILAAYNDKEGITKRFNLNLLERINRELGADFDINQFEHYPTYDPETGGCKSYLVSLADQQVNINGTHTIHFAKDEYIFMEISQKFTIQQIDDMARKASFKPVEHFFDGKKWFTDAIWVAG